MRPIPPPELMAALWAWHEKATLAERERCAKIVETFPSDILVFVDRPGGPPGNHRRPATKYDIADAIRR